MSAPTDASQETQRDASDKDERYKHAYNFDFAFSANDTHRIVEEVGPGSASQRLSRLANLFLTSGETYGDVQLSDGDSLLYTRQSDVIQFPHSIWFWIFHNPHPRDGPDPVEFMRFYREHNTHFFKAHKYDMLLERGFYGESILCHALLYDMPTLAKFILGSKEYKDPFPVDLRHEISLVPVQPPVNFTYESGMYHGEHACHIVAVKFKDANAPYNEKTDLDDQSAVFWMKLLIKAGADVTVPRARGSFFTIDEFYMGETVLSFAACMGNCMLVDYLVNVVGIDPSCRDSYGNNVLHVLCYWGLYDGSRANSVTNSTGSVPDDSNGNTRKNIEKKYGVKVAQIADNSIFALLCDRRSHYSFAVKNGDIIHRFKAEDLDIIHKKVDDMTVNLQGDTPLLVAIRRGNHKMVEAYLNYKGKLMWEFGPIKCTRYDLTEIDTYVDSKSMNHKASGLTIAVANNNVDVLRLPVFRELLDAKWRKYARKMFQLGFVYHVAGMLFFTAMLVLLPNDSAYFQNADIPPSRFPSIPNDLGANVQTTAISIIRIILEFAVLFDNILIAVRLGQRYRSVGGNFLTGFGRAENSAQSLRVLIFFCGAVCHFVPSAWQAENIFWGFYALIGWFEVFFYFRALESLGPLIFVVVQVLLNDVSQFMRIAVLFIIAFAEAFWLQMAPSGDMQHNELLNGNKSTSAGGAEWSHLDGAGWWTLRNFLIPGSSAYSDFRSTPIPIVAILAFLIFTFLVIVLINMFIAMVSGTFSRVTEKATDQWMLLRAQLILEYDERLLSEHYNELKKARLRDSMAENTGGPSMEEKEDRTGLPQNCEKPDLHKATPALTTVDQLPEIVTRIGVPRPLGRDDLEEFFLLKEGKRPHQSKCFYEMFVETEHHYGRVKVNRVVSSEDEENVRKAKKLQRMKEIKKSRRSVLE
ncbi:Transient receptor putative cation channel sub V member 2 [Entophlyctis sp. JEL0112]|nr:Transient receptor putative cation channel sub V member 2 [Entophlyctis sp. JEL0112]